MKVTHYNGDLRECHICNMLTFNIFLYVEENDYRPVCIKCCREMLDEGEELEIDE